MTKESYNPTGGSYADLEDSLPGMGYVKRHFLASEMQKNLTQLPPDFLTPDEKKEKYAQRAEEFEIILYFPSLQQYSLAADTNKLAELYETDRDLKRKFYTRAAELQDFVLDPKLNPNPSLLQYIDAVVYNTLAGHFETDLDMRDKFYTRAAELQDFILDPNHNPNPSLQ